MGTYDTRGGTPRHDPAFDESDGIMVMEEDVLEALERAQDLRQTYDAACTVLSDKITAALHILLKPGMVLQKHGSKFGTVTVAHGNARGALQFDVVGLPRITKLDVIRPSLTQFSVEAYPLNAAGKRMSGRSGNPNGYARGGEDTVSLSVYLCRDNGPDDMRSCNDLVTDLMHLAAMQAEASS